MDSMFFLRICSAAIGFIMLLGSILFMFYGKFRFRTNNEIMGSSFSPSSPSSSLPRNWTHQVFPSFCGEDVRENFFSYIQKEFQRKGITSFVDDEIKRGDSIGPVLLEAIRVSKISIVLLSKNYASSSWCLNELVEIMKCREEFGQVVMTIFYKVDPTDVKKQFGDFGKVFRKTCKGKTKEDVKRWRQALAEVATIAGYHSSNWRYEADMVEEIAIDVSNALNNSIPSIYFESLVGIGAHMENMRLLLSLERNEVRMVGIWGPAGIGKTTIARALYEKICGSFTHTAFIESIKGGYTTHYLDSYAFMLQLQELLLSKTLNHKGLKIGHLGVAQERLKDKKVLVVIDDVVHLLQLNSMADRPEWFGPGSRIIITTQDQNLLKAHGIGHIYKVDYPVDEEAFQIFCMNAFGQKFPKDGFEELAREVTKLSGKLPLGLRVMGSYFRGKSKDEWINVLPRLKARLHDDIKSILRFSYDALCDEDKDLFLYIACLFNLKSMQTLEDFLAKTFLDLSHGLHNLAEKTLISWEYGFIKMHSLLVQLGREIVRNQSSHKLGQRQFLIDAREICDVLTNETGSESLVGMDLDLSEINDEVHISDRTLERMCNLQFLRLYGRLDDYSGGRLYSPRNLKYISPKLRLLHWDYFPATCLPSSFIPQFLVELNMRNSELKKLWEGVQPLQNLKWIDLSISVNLEKLPDLSTATNLISLDLSYCSGLMELPLSIGNATSLLILNLDYCSSLVNIPSSVENIPNLKIFLAGCSSLVNLPSCIWNITALNTFSLENFSSSVQHSFTWNVRNFQDLDLSGCSSLKKLPSIVRATDLEKFPSSVGNVTNLHGLNLNGCSSLVELPSSIGDITNLKVLNLTGCSSLTKLPPNIEEIYGRLILVGRLTLIGWPKPEVLSTKINSGDLDENRLRSLLWLKDFCEKVFCYAIRHGYKGLALEITKLSAKHPLGLRILDSYVRGMSKQEWINALPRLWTRLHGEVKSILMFSYEALCHEDKELFLYIAWFFNNKSIQTLEDFLAKTFSDVSPGLRILAEKSFISLEYGFIKIDNLLVQLGREIVHNQSVHEPGQRQFLVDAREICEVLTNESGSRSLVGMDLNLSEINGKFNISSRTFNNMCNLQFLRFYGILDDHNGSRLYWPRSLEYLSPKLRLLHWDYFQTTCLPSSFISEFLVELNMRNSKLKKLWDGVQPLQNLKWMDLSYSKNLEKLPDLSTATNLLSLDLCHCGRLMKLPFSIGNATSLLILNIEYCSSLVNIPSTAENIPNLKLFLAGCSSLVQLPSCVWNVPSLNTFNLNNFSSSVQEPLMWNAKEFQDLDFSGCSSLKKLPSIVSATNLNVLVEFHSSVGNVTNLQKLNLNGCSSLVELPSSIESATNLRDLVLSGCSNLVELPSTIGNFTNLRELDLSGCLIMKKLPSSIGNATDLRVLDLTGCSSLMKLPSSIEKLRGYGRLRLKGWSKARGSSNQSQLAVC